MKNRIGETGDFLPNLKKKSRQKLKSNLKISSIDSENNVHMDTFTSLSTPLDLDQKFSFDDEDRRPKFNLSGTSLNVNDMDSIKYEENLNDKFRQALNLSSQVDEVTMYLNELIDSVVDKYENFYDSLPNVKLSSVSKLDKIVSFAFKFTQSPLNFCKAPPKICSHCNKEGHLQTECPQDQLPDLETLPDMNNEWRDE